MRMKLTVLLEWADLREHLVNQSTVEWLVKLVDGIRIVRQIKRCFYITATQIHHCNCITFISKIACRSLKNIVILLDSTQIYIYIYIYTNTQI
jgi:hypothetical protein